MGRASRHCASTAASTRKGWKRSRAVVSTARPHHPGPISSSGTRRPASTDTRVPARSAPRQGSRPAMRRSARDSPRICRPRAEIWSCESATRARPASRWSGPARCAENDPRPALTRSFPNSRPPRRRASSTRPPRTSNANQPGGLSAAKSIGAPATVVSTVRARRIRCCSRARCTESVARIRSPEANRTVAPAARTPRTARGPASNDASPVSIRPFRMRADKCAGPAPPMPPRTSMPAIRPRRSASALAA